MSAGLNIAEPGISLNDGYISGCKNAILQKRGFVRCPGLMGLLPTPIFAAPLRGLYYWRTITGVEKCTGIAGKKVKDINLATGATSDLYTVGTDTESWAAVALDKQWIATGSEMVKREADGNVYRVGIVPPVGATAVAASGGSLPVGVYQIYVSYARKVNGFNCLYSQGEPIASVTLTAGNQKINFTIPNSTDPQVNNKVVWMTDNDGAVHYYYGQTGNNTATALTLLDTTARDNSNLYAVVAVNNGTPPDGLQSVVYFDNRLWASKDNMLYYSQRGNLAGAFVYDVEKWPAGNYICYPSKIIPGGVFALGGDLFLSTEQGLLCQPGGDPLKSFLVLDAGLYFAYGRTIDVHRGSAWGLTNDGVRNFTPGVGFSEDISRKIKGEIDSIYANASSVNNTAPCGKIYRRSGKRTEYHLSYFDYMYSDKIPAKNLVLNIDNTMQISATEYLSPWEVWEYGSQFMFVDSKNALYRGISAATDATLAKENGCCDTNVYDMAGEFSVESRPRQLDVMTRVIMPDITAIEEWQSMVVMAYATKQLTAEIYNADDVGISTSCDVLSRSTTAALWDTALFDSARFPVSGPSVIDIKLPMIQKGKAFYIRLFQESDDIDLNVVDIFVRGTAESGRYT